MKLSAATAAITIALLSATIASAAGPVAWPVKDMKAAVRALGYPKPHPTKLACRGLGTATAGRFDSFRCVATYTHHRRRVFYTAGQGEGGWLCAGTTITGCKLLRRGFVTNHEADLLGSMGAVTDLAARGYLQNRGETYIPVHFCQQSGAGWACPFTVNGAQVTVTITLKRVKAGYVISGSAA